MKPNNECLPVRMGAGRETLPKPMTAAQARKYGQKLLRVWYPDLQRAGFEPCLFRSDPEIHGADYFRLSFGKR
jgi:hypothetical protein